MPNTTRFVSDLHFFHKRIMEFTKRPFADVDEMHAAIIADWNAEVLPGDIVYHLGDLSFLPSKKDQQQLYDILNQLNGTLINLKGNHDYSNMWQAHRAAQAAGKLRTGIYFEDTPYKEIKVNKKKIILCHYPIAAWNGQHHHSLHLFGHCHGNLNLPMGRAMDVGYDPLWEQFGMRAPISVEQVIAELAPRDAVYYDHHGEPRLTKETQ